MGGLCNCATGFINSCCLILSIPFLLAGYIMKLTANSPCDPILYKPLLGIGVFLFALSLLGILASCCGCTIFLWLYLSIVFVMIVVVSFTMVFGATVVKGGAGELIAGTPYREYRLEDFSSWLKNRIVDDEHWGNIRSCMIRHDACGKYQAYRSLVDLVQINSTKLTAIETGCCKPPTHCGFEYKTSTRWEEPEKEGAGSSGDPDCRIWSNEQEELCYDCGSCKAGYLAVFLKYWKKLTAFNLFLLVFLIFIFVIGCCSLCI